MLQSPRSLLLEPSFASSTPAARAELSVLIESDSDSEAGSPHSPAASPCLMELTMEEVAAAARCASPPSLPTCLMLEQLFPSAAGISACVPSADGLGVACADLLPRACAARCPAGCAPHGCGKQCGKLVEPLPGGGLLAFALAHPPSEVERSLMEAFAAALSDQLRPRGTAAGKDSLLSLLEAPPLHSPPAGTPHDAFWAPF